MTGADAAGQLYLRARAAMEAGRADRALALLESLVRTSPGNARAWQLLGFALRDEQRMPEALAALARAEQLDRENPLTAGALAQTRVECGLPAVEACRRALKLDPAREPLVASLAAAMVASGRRAEAELELERALGRRPDWLEGQRALAEIRWTAGDRQDFARGLAQACGAQPANLALRLAWFRSIAQARQWQRALDIISEGERLQGVQRAYLLARLFVAAESGAHATAEVLFEQTRDWRDDVRDLAWIRHCLRERRPADALSCATALTQTPAARLVWPYLSLIWRLLDDARAAWLEGDPLFAREVAVDLDGIDLTELARLLRTLHTARAPYVEQSVRGGTQTERPLFFRREPIVQKLRSRLLDAVGRYVAELPPFDPGHPLLGLPRSQLLLAGSWSVRLLDQGFNVPHTHPLGWISSAFYVSLPPAQQLGPPPAGWIRFGEAPPELGLELPAYGQIEPRAGRLVLFPSTLWHCTAPFESGERLAVAFDVRPPAW